jgi:uncharacterized protein (TIGR00255 family)
MGMIKGMTGFGLAQRQFFGGGFNLEIKSLNHKFLDLVFHLPSSFSMLEDKIKKEIQRKIKRGRVVVSVTFSMPPRQKVVLNKSLAREYYDVLKSLSRQLGLTDSIKISDIVNLSGVVEIQHPRIAPSFWPKIKSALNEALENLLQMREAEGVSIYKDLHNKLNRIQDILLLIPHRAKFIVTQKVKTLSKEELPLFLKSSDINEEITRLKYHISNFKNKLKKKKSAVGKELDFIAQELQREINTVGAKLPDTQITSGVIKIKDLIEKIREQLQNVE